MILFGFGTYGAYGPNLLRHDGPISHATFIDSGYVNNAILLFLQITYWDLT